VFKFDDRDGDGVHDPGEPGLAGWTIHVVDPSMNVITMNTGAQGGFCIGIPAPLTYTVSEVPQPGWTQTYPPPPESHIFPTQCGQLVNIEFGNVQVAPSTPTRTVTPTATRTATRTSDIPPID
jgi:hypothetical protein